MEISEAKLIRLKLQMYGYEKGKIPIEIESPIWGVVSMLTKLPETGIVKGKKEKIETIQSIGADFITSMFTLHGIKYASVEMFDKLRESGVLGDPQKVLSFLEDYYKIISPTEIPIELIGGHSMIGNIAKSIIIMPDDYYLANVPIIMSSIRLGDNLTTLSAATYAHELTHSQLESVRGSVRNYQNKELLPIFVEKIAIDEIDKKGKYVKKSNELRMRYLLERIALVNMFNKQGSTENNTLTEAVESSAVIVSTLKALNLYDKYVSGSEEVKKSIIKGIQDIFDGKQTLEDFLEKLDITLENSTSYRLIKMCL